METGFTRLRVAAISMKPQKWNKEANATKMEQLFRRACSFGARLAVTTEGALEGYVVEDVIRRTELARKLIEISEPENGEYVTRFRRLARRLGMCVCFGLARRASNNVFNTALFIDDKGTIRREHRKMQFAEGYDESWFFNRLGRKVRSFGTPFGNAGILICNDRWNPFLWRALVLDGARVILIPAYGSTSKRQDSTVLSMARKNGVPVVEANVGANLIISGGEVVAKEEGVDRVTVAEIDIPSPASARLARKLEREFLARRPMELAELLRKQTRGSGPAFRPR